MPKIILPTEIKDYETIKSSIIVGGDCTHPAGHCYGSDGGSGIPVNLKVAEGQGGSVEVWQLDAKKEVIESKEIYIKCQYCLKLLFVGIKDEKEII